MKDHVIIVISMTIHFVQELVSELRLSKKKKTPQERARILAIRAGVHLAVLCILAAALYAIYSVNSV